MSLIARVVDYVPAPIREGTRELPAVSDEELLGAVQPLDLKAVWQRLCRGLRYIVLDIRYAFIELRKYGPRAATFAFVERRRCR